MRKLSVAATLSVSETAVLICGDDVIAVGGDTGGA